MTAHPTKLYEFLGRINAVGNGVGNMNNGSAVPKEPSAIELLANLSYADSQKLAGTLYLRQLELQGAVQTLAQHYHAAHCRHTMQDFADCYAAVCTANRKLLDATIVPRVGDLPSD